MSPSLLELKESRLFKKGEHFSLHPNGVKTINKRYAINVDQLTFTRNLQIGKVLMQFGKKTTDTIVISIDEDLFEPLEKEINRSNKERE